MKAGLFIAVSVLVLFLGGIIAILIWVDPSLPFLQKSAYLSLALISGLVCVMLIVLIALVVILAVLVGVLNNLTKTKVSPLIDKVSEVTDTARGTVAYVGEGVVSPMVRLAAILAGLRGAITALFRKRS